MFSQKCWDVKEMIKIIRGGQIPLLFRDLILRGISDGIGMSQSQIFYYEVLLLAQASTLSTNV